MKKNIKRLSILNILILGLVGCATDDAGRNAARVTLTQVVTYEKELDKKIAGETKFFGDVATIFNKKMEVDSVLNENNLYLVESQDYVRELSSLNGRLTQSDLRDTVYEGITKVIEIEAEIEARRTTLKAELLSSLEKLEREKKGLQKVRKGLTDLQTKPSDRQQLDALITFVSETKTIYDKKAEEAADSK
jgi:hypothetical protein